MTLTKTLDSLNSHLIKYTKKDERMKFYEAMYKLGSKANEAKENGETNKSFTIAHPNKDLTYLVEYIAKKGVIKLDIDKGLEIPLDDENFSIVTITSGK